MSADKTIEKEEPEILKFDVSHAATATHNLLGTVHLFCILPASTLPIEQAIHPAGCLAIIHRDPTLSSSPSSVANGNDPPGRGGVGIARSITTVVVGKKMSRGAESQGVSRTNSGLKETHPAGHVDELWRSFSRDVKRQSKYDENIFAGVPQMDLAAQLALKYTKLVEQRDVKLLPPHVFVRRIELSSWRQGVGDTFAAMCEPADYWALCHHVPPKAETDSTVPADSKERLEENAIAGASEDVVAEVERLLGAVAVDSDDEQPGAADLIVEEVERIIEAQGITTTARQYLDEAAALREMYNVLDGLATRHATEPASYDLTVSSSGRDGNSVSIDIMIASASSLSRTRYEERCNKWLTYVECVDRDAGQGAASLQTPSIAAHSREISRTRRQSNRPARETSLIHSSSERVKAAQSQPKSKKPGGEKAPIARAGLWDSSFL